MVVGAAAPLDHHIFCGKFPMVFYLHNGHRGASSHQIPSLHFVDFTRFVRPRSRCGGRWGKQRNTAIAPPVPSSVPATSVFLVRFWTQTTCQLQMNTVLSVSGFFCGNRSEKKKQDKLPSIKASVKNESTLCITEWVGMPNLKSNSCAAAS